MRVWEDELLEAAPLNKADEQRELERRCAWEDMLRAYSGRWVLWDILSECGIYNSSFGSDNRTTNFNEGRRSAGLKLLKAILTLNSEVYTIMQREAADRDKRFNELGQELARKQQEETDG